MGNTCVWYFYCKLCALICLKISFIDLTKTWRHAEALINLLFSMPNHPTMKWNFKKRNQNASNHIKTHKSSYRSYRLRQFSFCAMFFMRKTTRASSTNKNHRRLLNRNFAFHFPHILLFTRENRKQWKAITEHNAGNAKTSPFLICSSCNVFWIHHRDDCSMRAALSTFTVLIFSASSATRTAVSFILSS